MMFVLTACTGVSDEEPSPPFELESVALDVPMSRYVRGDQIVLAPDGKVLYLTEQPDYPNSIHVWTADLEGGNLCVTCDLPETVGVAVDSFALHPDGEWLLFTQPTLDDRNSHAKILRSVHLETRQVVDLHTAVTALSLGAFDAAGSRLLWAESDDPCNGCDIDWRLQLSTVSFAAGVPVLDAPEVLQSDLLAPNTMSFSPWDEAVYYSESTVGRRLDLSGGDATEVAPRNRFWLAPNPQHPGLLWSDGGEFWSSAPDGSNAGVSSAVQDEDDNPCTQTRVGSALWLPGDGLDAIAYWETGDYCLQNDVHGFARLRFRLTEDTPSSR